MPKRHIPLIAAVLAVSVLAGILFSVRVSAAGVPSLFYNDEKWYKDSTACLEIVEGISYVPVDIFCMFPHIELSMNSRQGEFMLYNRANGRFISVLYNERMATVDGAEEIYLNLYKLHGGYYYVPAEYFCGIMDLHCETVSSAAEGAGFSLRISDGTQTKTVQELLALYGGESGDTSSSVPDTPPQPPVTSGAEKTERTLYLTFNTILPDNLTKIRSALSDAAVKAAFFFTEEELLAHPEAVTSLAADGHTVGLRCEAASDAADFLAQMDGANEILCGLVKSTSRIVQLPDGAFASGLTKADADAILAAGYVLWDYTYDVPDSRGYAAYAVRNSTAAAVKNAEISVLRMSTNDTVIRILPELLAGWRKDGNVHIEPIRASGAEVRPDFPESP